MRSLAVIEQKKLLCLLLALIAPLALAAPSARQDYVDAMRATPDAARGAGLFATCAGCHGADGRGLADGSVPRIAGQHRQVLIKQIVDYRYARRGDPRMESVAVRHQLKSAQAIADVAQFVATLEPVTAVGLGRGEHLELGRQIYLGRCGSCHGRAGEGDAQAAAPRLAGQHYMYLLRQLHDALEGRRPTLGDTHNRMLKDLDRDGLQALADMLARTDATDRARR
jgi:cytochrome c553